MNVEIREIEHKRVLSMSHHGPYNLIGTTFMKFGAWVKAEGIRIGPFVGIYYDDPSTTPPEELRSEAGAYVDDHFTIDHPLVHVVGIPGGTYAVYTHVGSYDLIGGSWERFMGDWFPTSGYEYGDGSTFEVYVDDSDVTPLDILRTELWLPVKTP